MVLERDAKVDRNLTTRLRWLDHEEYHRSAIGWIGPHAFLPAYCLYFSVTVIASAEYKILLDERKCCSSK
jgi:hypothetical protein